MLMFCPDGPGPGLVQPLTNAAATTSRINANRRTAITRIICRTRVYNKFGFVSAAAEAIVVAGATISI
jgi:hypothetical protein